MTRIHTVKMEKLVGNAPQSASGSTIQASHIHRDRRLVKKGYTNTPCLHTEVPALIFISERIAFLAFNLCADEDVAI